jgi:chromosome segregation protein
MYLEKLVIAGFKSFANRNELSFPGELNKEEKRGITAIVGPNGSGKSNIADAVRWVLGEQSSKTLRGKKSEDIIFAGSDKKSRLGLAEVSLFLKNEEKKVVDEDSPFKYDKLIITRKISRSGDSEYLINNNKVRLLDIQMLLAKANIGQKTYSVIGQGMVENFLNTSTSERKEFFDEATGVKPWQIKREASLNKLERSYENLDQADMLLSEIKPRLSSLTRQVDKLKRKEQLDQDLKFNQLQYYGLSYQKINEQLNEHQQNINALENEKSTIKEKLNKLNLEIENFKTTLIDQDLENEQKELNRQEEEKNSLLNKLANIQAEISVSLEAKGHFDISWLKQKKDELQQHLENEQKNLSLDKLAQLQSEEKKLKDSWQELQRKSAQIENNKEKIENLNNQYNQYFKQESKIEVLIENYLNQQSSDAHDSLVAEIETIKNDLKKEKAILDNDATQELTTKINKLELNLDDLNKKIKAHQNNLEKLQNDKQKLAQEKVSKDYIAKEIQIFLEQLEKLQTETDLNKLKEVIKKIKEDFANKFSQFLDFKESKYIEKIEEEQGFIIQLGEEKQAIMERINEQKLLLMQKKEEQSTLNQKINNLKQSLNEKTTLLAEKNNQSKLNSLKEEKKELEEKTKNILNQIEEIQTENLSLKSDNKDSLLNRLNNYRLQISSEEEKQHNVKQKINELSTDLIEIDNKIKKAQHGLKLDDLEKDKSVIEKRLSQVKEAINVLEKKIMEKKLKHKNKTQEVLDKQKSAENLRSIIHQKEEKLHQLEIKVAKLETKLEDLETSISNANLNLVDIKTYSQKSNVNPEELINKIEKIKKQLNQIGNFDPDIEDEYIQTKERYDFLFKQSEDLKQTINSLEEIIDKLDQDIKAQFNQEFKIITEKFNQYFQILFKGGSAKIIKLEHNDNEEEKEEKNNIKSLRKKSALGISGIDIQAIPPGKKIQSIAMLSGGERALTAIALICAIIKANPSPFVMLDEVDAALDEANSERLAKILDDLSSDTQFIIITHNRASMKQAKVLYGITMQADGVSKLLSVKLDDLI